MANILLLEPDRVLADTYRLGLEAHGHRVVMCASAQSAIFAADELSPELIILELQLIGHSGIEFLYEFRSYPDWQRVPVLVQSHVPANEFSDCWQVLQGELNIAEYLYKPLTSLADLARHVADSLPVALPA